MDGIERHDGHHAEEQPDGGRSPRPSTGGSHEPGWLGDEARIESFSGVVGEVADPMTWGLDLEEETLTGMADEHDPSCERFVRSYRCFTGEALEVETLRIALDEDEVEDVVRAACSGALAAPLHADIAAPVDAVDASAAAEASPEPDGSRDAAPDFADSFGDYRTAMRALVAEVDAAPLMVGTFGVDGVDEDCVVVTARSTCAVYVGAVGRALVVTGPAELVDRVDVVTRPVAELLARKGRHHASSDEPPADDAH